MTQLVERLLLKHEDLYLDLHHPIKVWWYTPLTSEREEQRQADLRAHWLASLAESASCRSETNPVLKKIR